MANGTQYNITVNADGVSTALERAQNSWEKFSIAVDLAGQKAIASQKGLEEATRNGGAETVRAQRSVKSFMESLVQQAATAGMTSEQMLQLRAAQLGVADSAAPLIAQAKAAREAMQAQAAAAQASAAAQMSAQRELTAAQANSLAQQTAAADLAAQAQVATGAQRDQLLRASASAAAAQQAADAQAASAQMRLNAANDAAAFDAAKAKEVADARAAEFAKSAAAKANADLQRALATGTAAQQAAAQQTAAAAAQRAQAAIAAAAASSSAAQQAASQAAASRQIADQQAVADAAARARQQALGGAGGGGANPNGGISDAQRAAAMRMMPAQFTDIVVQLQGGANPLTVMLQQGGQIKDMFGGIKEAAKGMGSYLVGLFNPVTLGVAAVIGGLVAVGAAMYVAHDETKKLNSALALSGGYAGVTAGQINVTAQSLSSLKGGEGAAIDVLTALVKTGQVGGAAMESAGRAVMDFARVSGESADKVTSLMQPMFEDPTKGAAKLNETMHFLTIAQYDQIKAMQEHGDKAGALKVAMDAMDASITSQTTQLGYLGQAWKWVKEQANGFWRAMVDWGKTDTVEEVGKKLQKDIDDLQKKINTEWAGQSRSGYKWPGQKAQEERLAAMKADLAKHQEEAGKAQRAAQQKAERDQAALDHIAATNESFRVADNAAKRKKKIDDANATFKTRSESLDKTSPDYASNLKAAQELRDATIAAAEHDFKDPKTPKPKHEKAVTNDASQRMIIDAEKATAALDLQLKTQEKLGEWAKKRAEFEQQIAGIQAKSEGKRTADEKALLLNKAAVMASLDAAVAKEREVQSQEKLNKLKERSAQLDADIASYQQGNREQYDRQLGALGMGKEQQQRVEAQKAIYKQYQRETEKLNKETAPELIGGTEHQAALAKIQTGLQQSLADYDAYYAALKEKQGDWVLGVKQGWADYVDQQQNVFQQTASIVNNATNGMSDAFAKFCETGKLDFKSLATSIIADIARMQARASVSGLFNSAIGAVSSFFGGAAGGTSALTGIGGDTIAGSVAGSISGMAGGNVFGFHADGGAIRGPGTGTSDSIPAMLSNGEYVIKASAVQQIGIPALDAINSGRAVHSAAHFATGGAVGSASTSTFNQRGGSMSLNIPVTIEGGSGDASQAMASAEFVKRLTQMVQGLIAAESRQGGSLWKLRNGIG
ncbi:hypothetical protein WJ56_09330 [Burkholderia ubonensis]|uniref:phage tail tape measure protein n=1 Tax=Burkholderia ubonensis TaxID=101571 RepID=UPI000759F86B|nr:phage tail tape measure protein [Burkholderia ubonensis]KVM05488.1 hypothetical protein WJ51_26225 [Burkholderia ubonensis]KVM09631.1 hypothetical protein WJ52_23525 [Burkholderia ubonensis]KVM53181.1 hypothetical protein WJ56_09330 [Burkholderia ubonensis]